MPVRAVKPTYAQFLMEHTAGGIHISHPSETLAAYLAAAYPFNSKGNTFGTLQAAIDDLAGDGWVFVPAGTWNEALDIDENNVVLFGAGWSSIINGGTTFHGINISGDNCVVRDLQCKTTAGGGENYSAIYIGGPYGRFINVYVSQSDAVGVTISGTYCVVIGCRIENTDGNGIGIGGMKARVAQTYIYDTGENAIHLTSPDNVIHGNIIDTTIGDGIVIHADAENCVVDGNRITNWVGEAIDDDSGTSTIGDNDLT